LNDPGRRATVHFRLVAAALVVGALTGAVGAGFRAALLQAQVARDALLAWAHGRGAWGVAVPVLAVAAATGLARWMVIRFAPHAAGSGIPQVESVVRSGEGTAPLSVLPVKFLGGLLAIGAGLALGREGPTVQMGASIGGALTRFFRLPPGDDRVLVAGGAGAGLATAFGAPIGGAVFILEEVLQRFHGRTTIAVLGATGAAVAVSDALIGNAPIFSVGAVPEPRGVTLFLFLGFGLVVGLAGVLYNRLLLAGLDLVDRIPGVPTVLVAAAIGTGVGLIAFVDPRLVGGGEPLIQSILSGTPPGFALLVAFAAVRFVLGPASYATMTPGGLFAPLLLLGSLLGAIAAHLLQPVFPGLVPDGTGFAIAGAVALFTASVRAPVTGVTLLVEMTGASTLLMPMLAAACGAFVGASLMGSAPIYESLRTRGAPAAADAPPA
jgi:chloride channel protein, CIC family